MGYGLDSILEVKTLRINKRFNNINIDSFTIVEIIYHESCKKFLATLEN